MIIKDEGLRNRLSAGAIELSKKEDIKVLNQKLLGVYNKLLQE
jgi:hypothetical protein